MKRWKQSTILYVVLFSIYFLCFAVLLQTGLTSPVSWGCIRDIFRGFMGSIPKWMIYCYITKILGKYDQIQRTHHTPEFFYGSIHEVYSKHLLWLDSPDSVLSHLIFSTFLVNLSSKILKCHTLSYSLTFHTLFHFIFCIAFFRL